VHPRIVPVRRRDRGGERVERSGVQVAGLKADDRRHGWRAVQLGVQRVDVDSTLLIGRHDDGGAEAEVAQREIDGVVALSTHQHPDGRAAGEAAAADLPTRFAQYPLARGGEAAEVGHRGTGDETERCAPGRPSRSRTQRAAVSSAATTPGVANRRPAF
jgi:hypothetical protein